MTRMSANRPLETDDALTLAGPAAGTARSPR